MRVYLVRWPDLSAALVKAGSEDELIEILDEVANPDGCTWNIYRGGSTARRDESSARS